MSEVWDITPYNNDALLTFLTAPLDRTDSSADMTPWPFCNNSSTRRTASGLLRLACHGHGIGHEHGSCTWERLHPPCTTLDNHFYVITNTIIEWSKFKRAIAIFSNPQMTTSIIRIIQSQQTKVKARTRAVHYLGGGEDAAHVIQPTRSHVFWKRAIIEEARYCQLKSARLVKT